MANNSQEVLKFIVSLSKGVTASLADGKYDVRDLLNFVGAVQDLGPAIEDVDKIPAELSLMSEEDRASLFAIVSQIDLPSDQVEAWVQKGLKAGIMIAELLLPLVKKA